MKSGYFRITSIPLNHSFRNWNAHSLNQTCLEIVSQYVAILNYCWKFYIFRFFQSQMHIKIILHPLQGGALWFQNLTEFPHGVSGPIFPLLIAGLHYINIQVYDSLVSLH